MLNDMYCILSFPVKEKHYVLRTSKSERDILLRVDEFCINSSIISITDSYEEAVKVYNNIKGEQNV